MFETLIHLLHQVALNALGLVIALLSGELPVSEPALPPEPAAQHHELRLDALPDTSAFATCNEHEVRHRVFRPGLNA